MVLHALLKRLIKFGTLILIDSSGREFTFAATKTPVMTLRLHSKKIERRLFYSPILALGEGYMNEELSFSGGNLYEFLDFLVINVEKSKTKPFLASKFLLLDRFLHRCNSIHQSKQNVAHHYDLRRELYELFLDKDMQYSCAYFSSLSDSLEIAQENKKRHLVAKLSLKPGQKVLDIGSGWGGLALYIAQETQADVTGLTLSEEQLKVSSQRAKEAGLSDRVRFYLRDYRQEQGLYDRIVSVGMFEHVGIKNYGEFFKQIHALLKEDGIALLHSIGCSTGPSVPNLWLEKYIFPGGYCPALSETLTELEPSKLHVTDIEILHHHYAETLRHWRIRFMANRDKVKLMLGECFCRMWEYYLVSCELAFRRRGYMVFQIQMVKDPSIASLTRDYITQWEEEHAPSAQQKSYGLKSKESRAQVTKHQSSSA